MTRQTYGEQTDLSSTTVQVSTEQRTAKKPAVVDCHCICGKILAKRGQYEEADSSFQLCVRTCMGVVWVNGRGFPPKESTGRVEECDRERW